MSVASTAPVGPAADQVPPLATAPAVAAGHEGGQAEAVTPVAVAGPLSRWDDGLDDEQRQAKRRWSEAMHARLVQEEAGHPLELAALGLLRSWETSANGYSVEEMMALARWAEAKLAPPPRPPLGLVRSTMLSLRKASLPVQLASAATALLAAAVFLVLLAAFTGLAIERTKVVSVRPPGWLTMLAEDGTGRRAAGLGVALHRHHLLDFPSLPLEDLRRVQDVSFSHQGNFHHYRVASVAQLMGVSARIEAEDGTLVRVEAGHVSVARPFTPGQVLSPGDAAASTGAFPVLVLADL